MSISSLDLAFFNRQLASMVRLQTPLAEGFASLAHEVHGKRFKTLLQEIHGRISEGQSLSQALASHPDVFPPPYITLVEAGEKSRNLDAALESMADYSETTVQMKTSIVNICIIPLLTFIVGLAVIIFLSVTVLPRFQEIFDSMGVELPILTCFVLRIAAWVHDCMAYILGGLILLIVILCVSYERRMVWLDWVVLHLPFIGQLVRTAHYTKFSMVMAHLLQSRIPLVDSLALTQKVLTSPMFQQAVADMKAAVANGESLSDQGRASGMFPETMNWKLAFAEKKGTLTEAFQELHRYFHRYFQMLVPRMLYLVVPILTILFGLFVAAMILAVMLPIFKLQSQLAG